jgi:hypothetical protein
VIVLGCQKDGNPTYAALQSGDNIVLSQLPHINIEVSAIL